MGVAERPSIDWPVIQNAFGNLAVVDLQRPRMAHTTLELRSWGPDTLNGAARRPDRKIRPLWGAGMSGGMKLWGTVSNSQ